jgi:HEPN domain-containing protein
MAAPNSNDLKILCHQRIKEAEFLVTNDFVDLAFYVTGYSIELALKAAICKSLDIDDFFAVSRSINIKEDVVSKFKTHDFRTLLILAGLTKKLDEDKGLSIDLDKAAMYLEDNYGGWSPNIRYSPIGSKTEEEVLGFIKITKIIVQWIEKYW